LAAGVAGFDEVSDELDVDDELLSLEEEDEEDSDFVSEPDFSPEPFEDLPPFFPPSVPARA
jgi:hypothetical protein